MNPVYLQICVALGNFLMTLLYVAWRKGKDDQTLLNIVKAHDDLKKDTVKAQEALEKDKKQLQDDVEQLSKDLNRLYGWLRAYTGSPLNGGSH